MTSYRDDFQERAIKITDNKKELLTTVVETADNGKRSKISMDLKKKELNIQIIKLLENRHKITIAINPSNTSPARMISVTM